MPASSWTRLQPLLETPTLADLGPGPRPGVQSESDLAREVDTILGSNSGVNVRLAKALILLWHDHLDSAHTIAQEIENPDGSFVHGIMHRREPDFNNARYWFRHVGAHPTYDELGSRVQALLNSTRAPGALDALAAEARWDPFTFISACEKFSARSGTETALLQQIQRIETEVLLERFTGA